MTLVRRWAMAVVAALTIGAAGAGAASAAPLAGLNQAATSVHVAAETADTAVATKPVYYARRFYRYRPYYRRHYYRPRYYRPYYRPYYRHYYRRGFFF